MIALLHRAVFFFFFFLLDCRLALVRADQLKLAFPNIYLTIFKKILNIKYSYKIHCLVLGEIFILDINVFIQFLYYFLLLL